MFFNSHEYDPFGQVIRVTGPMAKNNPYRFSTKYQDDESVDSELAEDARKMAALDPGIYVLLFKDCGSFANDWMRHARDVLRQAEDSFPTYP